MNPRWSSSHVRDYEIVIPEPHRLLINLFTRDAILFVSEFEIRRDAPLADQYRYVNRVNERVKFIRACIVGPDLIWFSSDLGVDGGLCPEALVRTTQRILAGIGQALGEDVDHVLAGPA